jgi:hypothetical protein
MYEKGCEKPVKEFDQLMEKLNRASDRTANCLDMAWKLNNLLFGKEIPSKEESKDVSENCGIFKMLDIKMDIILPRLEELQKLLSTFLERI